MRFISKSLTAFAVATMVGTFAFAGPGDSRLPQPVGPAPTPMPEGGPDASFVESFETGMPTTAPLPNHASPGAALNLASGQWWARNNSVPVGSTGVFGSNLLVTPFGTQHAAMNFNNGASVATINTWLMTPEQTLQNGDTFSFFSRTVNGPAFPDRLRVHISTAGASTDPASFGAAVLSINEGLTVAGYPSVWTQYTVTVSGLAGATQGRFGFNYNVPSGGPSGVNSDFIGIDNVVYTQIPEPATLGLLAGAGLLVLRRRRA
jgi:hypothetical protein